MWFSLSDLFYLYAWNVENLYNLLLQQVNQIEENIFKSLLQEACYVM